MSVTYNSENVFARILRKELPCRLVLETEFLLAFHDLHPKAPVHVLAIPKGPYCNAVEFHQKAEVKEIAGFYQDLNKVIALLGLDSCRLMTNVGKDAGQIVDHFHMHILGGRVLKEAP
jgi:histidine triad (HIT) family protein